MYFANEDQPRVKSREVVPLDAMMEKFKERRRTMWEKHVKELIESGKIERPKVKIVRNPRYTGKSDHLRQ